jgi:hypothetical protein
LCVSALIIVVVWCVFSKLDESSVDDASDNRKPQTNRDSILIETPLHGKFIHIIICVNVCIIIVFFEKCFFQMQLIRVVNNHQHYLNKNQLKDNVIKVFFVFLYFCNNCILW